LCHAAVGCQHGHKAPFKRCAKAIGLEGKMAATVPGDRLKRRLHAICRECGPYPHDRLTPPPHKVQSTRMLKVECPECRCIVRMMSKWLAEAGPPTCGCGSPMEPADKGA
jgi:hypothetical protein